MNINKVFTPFSFYSDILLQNRFKPRCKNDCVNGLISPNNRFLCFQFRRPATGQPITAFELYDLNDNLILSIPTYYVRQFATSDYDYFIYQGENLLVELTCGEYYLKITTGSRSYFSEVFEVKKFEQYFEPSTYGVINNGNFADTNYWNVNNGTTQWEIIGNKAVHTADGSINILQYTHFNNVTGSTVKFPIQVGKTVRIKFTLSDFATGSGGTLRVTTSNGVGGGVVFSSAGTHEFTTVATHTFLRFIANATFTGKVSDVSVFIVEDFKNCDKIYLKWRNACDIYNIKFVNFGNVYSEPGFNNTLIYNSYANELFLETEIGEPEYREFQEEVEDNEFNKIATFKKDSKWFKLNTLSVAEFLVDAFSILHRFDFIRIYDPYKDELHQVMELEWLNEWIFDACFGEVNLTWKDFDLIADACCDEVVATPCLECVEEIADFVFDHELPDPEGYEEGDIVLQPGDTSPLIPYWLTNIEIYKLISGDWVLQKNPAINTLYCFTTEEEEPFVPSGEYMYLGDGTWIRFPFIYATINPDNICQIIIKAFLLPGMFAEIFYKNDFDTPAFISYGSFSAEELTEGVILTSPRTSSYQYFIKANVTTLNCDYGETPTINPGGGGGSPSCQFAFVNYEES